MVFSSYYHIYVAVCAPRELRMCIPLKKSEELPHFGYLNCKMAAVKFQGSGGGRFIIFTISLLLQ